MKIHLFIIVIVNKMYAVHTTTSTRSMRPSLSKRLDAPRLGPREIDIYILYIRTTMEKRAVKLTIKTFVMREIDEESSAHISHCGIYACIQLVIGNSLRLVCYIRVRDSYDTFLGCVRNSHGFYYFVRNNEAPISIGSDAVGFCETNSLPLSIDDALQ